MELASYVLFVFAGFVIIFAVFLAIKQRGKERKVNWIDRIKEDLHDLADDVLENLRRGRASWEDYYHLGNLLREKGKAGKALKLHLTLLAEPRLSEEDKKRIYRTIGYDYIKMGRYREAIKFLERVGNRSDRELTGALERSYRMVKDYTKAIMEKKRLIELEGDDYKREVSSYIAWCAGELIKEGKKEEAHNLLKEALKIYDASPMALYLMGKLFLEDSKNDKARDIWIKLYRTSERFRPMVIDSLEELLYEMGETTRFKGLLDEAEDTWSKLKLAEISYKMGNIEEAERIVNEILRRDDVTISVYLQLYRLLKEFGGELSILALLTEKVMETVGNIPKYRCSNCKEELNEFYFICPRCEAIDTICESF